jgi:chromosome segregation ATPase
MDKQITAYKARDVQLNARLEKIETEAQMARSQAAIKIRKLESQVINERDKAERGVNERDLISKKYQNVNEEREALSRECKILQRQGEDRRKLNYEKDKKLRAQYAEKIAAVEDQLSRVTKNGCDGSCKSKISELVHQLDALRRQHDNAQRALDRCMPGGNTQRVLVEDGNKKGKDEFIMPGSFMKNRGASAIAAKTSVIVRKRKK